MTNKHEPSEMGKKGGRARAESLTPEQRSEIARKGAEARWSKGIVVAATHVGEIKLSDTSISCAVLEDATRVLTQADFLEALGRHRKANVRRESLEEQLPAIIQGKSIKPFIDSDLVSKSKPIKFRLPNGGIASGYRAEILPLVCEVYLKARDANALPHNQQHVAIQADILMRGLARVGISALVDEATGYERDRERNALAKILEAFVAKEIQKWIKTFDLEFYELICKVRNEPLSRAYKRPAYFGHLTNDIVYRRLAPGVLQKLRTKNPVDESGIRKQKHFQHLTPEIGHPKLKEHLVSVTTLLKVVNAQGGDWDDFMRLLDNLHAPYLDMPLFNQLDEEKDVPTD